MGWTDKQLDAIRAEGNVIVSAAAGSGKTAVLTERICRLVSEEGVRIEELLVLTFTRAAASEMKHRIRTRLASAAQAAGPDRKDALYAAAAAVGQASISTIDSFCAGIVRRHAHTLSLSPAMRILDEGDLAEWKERTLHDVFLRGSRDADLAVLYDRIGGTDSVQNAILRLNGFLDSLPDPDRWLETALSRYASPESCRGYMDAAAEAAGARLRELTRTLEEERNRIDPCFESVLARLDEELSACRGAMLQKGYAPFREALLSLRSRFARLTFPKKGFDPDEAEKIKAARKALKDGIDKLTAGFQHTTEEEHAALERSAQTLRALANVTSAFRTAFSELKRKNNAMDYPDLGRFSLKILENERIAEEYRNRYRFIAVDEYQDTNRLNDAIITRVSRGNNLFYVGDIKQSIYGFRRAEPSLFRDKMDSFRGANGRRIDLQNNFRSAPEVLDAVNELFLALMREDTNELVYDDAAMLVPGDDRKPGSVSLLLIDRASGDGNDPGAGQADPAGEEDPEADGEEELIEDLGEAVLEARCIAKKILELMQTVRLRNDDGKEVPLRYGDIAILMRSLPDSLTISSTLAENGIPCYAQASNGYFDATEVLLVLHCLSLIDNGAQDIPLAAVMLSAIGGFSPDELALLRAEHRGIPFYEAVDADAERNEKTRAFLRRIDSWRADSRRIPVQELISRIVTETSLHHIMGAMQSGDVRRGNLDALMAQASVFEADGVKGLPAFLNHIGTVRKNVSIGSAQFASENVVRVITMHKSKGLQFPVVFLPRLGKKFNTRDSTELLMLHDDLGMGIRYAAGGVRFTTTAWTAIRNANARKAVSEEMRVLYVAMTRAKNHLILMGTVKKYEKDRWSAGSPRPDSGAVSKAVRFLDWIALTPREHMPLTVLRAETLRQDAAYRARPSEQDSSIREALRENLDWKYPYTPKPPLPRKTSVSRIRADEIPGLVSFRDPGEDESAPVTAAQIGTAAHALLQQLPLPLRPLTEEEVAAQTESMKSAGTLAPEAAGLIRADRIAAFTQGDLWQRMSRSDRLERELPFHVQLEASRFYPDAEAQKIILQGIIDCCFIEDGGWVLLDYKTDRIPEGTDPASIAEKHRIQLGLYAEALTKLTGLPVREQWIALLSGPVSVRLA